VQDWTMQKFYHVSKRHTYTDGRNLENNDTICTRQAMCQEELLTTDGRVMLANRYETLIRVYKELQIQLRTSIPAIIGMVINKIPWLLSLHFAGNLGTQELAAAALATTLCNVTGMSLSVGLSSALSTLTGQSRGNTATKSRTLEDLESPVRQVTNTKWEGEALLTTQSDQNTEHYGSQESNVSHTVQEEFAPNGPMIYLLRGTFIQLLFVIPVGLWWIHGTQDILISLGQEHRRAIMTSRYLRILAPGLWGYSINWTLTSWLQAIEMADVPACAAALAAMIHLPMNLLFIHVFQWGYLGVGAATVVSQMIQPLYIILYIFLTDHGKTRVLENIMPSTMNRRHLIDLREIRISILSFYGIFQYLSLAIPGIVIISEWWASELCIFLSGTLRPYPALALDAMTIYQSINTACFMLPVGCSISGTTRVGNLLGAGDDGNAHMAANVAVGTAAILSILVGCLLFLTPHTLFPSIFSPDVAVIEEASRLIPLLSIYVVGDGVQTALNGIIKGCGRQFIIMPIVLIAYWIIGVPLAYYFTFVRHNGFMCNDSLFCGVSGLVSGLTIGTWVHMILLAIVVVSTTDWRIEAQKALKRVSKGIQSSK
jgi:multidrug resistance protein, MATE family